MNKGREVKKVKGAGGGSVRKGLRGRGGRGG